MKKLTSVILTLCLATGFAFAQNPAKTVEILPVDKLPKAEKYLPQPPSLTDPLYFNDFVQYQKGKEVRNTERGKVAVDDYMVTTEYYMKRFGEVMGFEMTPETHPAMAAYISATFTTARTALQSAKDSFHRLRPFVQFNEPSGIPEDENESNFYQSYPSGHTVRAWYIALALVGVDPVHQNEILKVGYEMGQSRVIVGFHYQSDVDAARVAGSAIYALLSVEPAYQDLFRKAKAEFDKKK